MGSLKYKDLDEGDIQLMKDWAFAGPVTWPWLPWKEFQEKHPESKRGGCLSDCTPRRVEAIVHQLDTPALLTSLLGNMLKRQIVIMRHIGDYARADEIAGAQRDLKALKAFVDLKRNPELPGDTDIEKMSRIAKALHAIHIPIEVDCFKAETPSYDLLDDPFNPAELAEYVEGWTYRADREMPPDKMSEFTARGYEDATGAIG